MKELNKKKAEEEKKAKVKELSSQQGIKIKTKIAQGPNPLSVKKKRRVDKYQQKGSGSEEKVKRKRIL